jgi:hypothetical protein
MGLKIVRYSSFYQIVVGSLDTSRHAKTKSRTAETDASQKQDHKKGPKSHFLKRQCPNGRWLLSPAAIVRIAIHPCHAPIDGPDRVTRIVGSTPMAPNGRNGTFSAGFVNSTALVFLVRLRLVDARDPLQAPIDTALFMTDIVVLTPMAPAGGCGAVETRLIDTAGIVYFAHAVVAGAGKGPPGSIEEKFALGAVHIHNGIQR